MSESNYINKIVKMILYDHIQHIEVEVNESDNFDDYEKPVEVIGRVLSESDRYIRIVTWNTNKQRDFYSIVKSTIENISILEEKEYEVKI